MIVSFIDIDMVQLGKLFKLGQMILHSPETKNCVITWYQRVSTTQGGREVGGRYLMV